MTRTPLLGRLQQLYRDFVEHEATGQSIERIVAQRLRQPSRRDFLKLAAAGSAATLARPSKVFAVAPRIVIVGGGIAGLHAALTLHDAGLSSTVYEASARLGGRMHSDTTSWLNNQVSEHCGELIDTGHKTILGLAKRFKIGVADLSGAQPAHSTDTNYFFRSVLLDRRSRCRFWAGLPRREGRRQSGGLSHALHQLHASRIPARSNERVRLDRKPSAGRTQQPDGATARCRLQHRVRRRHDRAKRAQFDLRARVSADRERVRDPRSIRRALPSRRRQRRPATRDRRFADVIEPQTEHIADTHCAEW